MRNLTKESREQSRNYQFAKLIETGYTRETYKALDFFTKDDSQLFTLKVYRGTAANHEEYINYRTAERRAEIIARYKTNLDSREEYKAEQKSKAGVKITLATLKAFLNKNETNIYVKVKSSFDGMSDMVEQVKDEFSHVERSENIKDHNLGFSGLYLVGSSRDSINVFENEIYTGFEVYNCCGSCLIATPKVLATKTATKPTAAPVEVPAGKIQIIDYSEKAIAVIGETKPMKDQLRELGGSFNARLSCGAGWIFPKSKLEAVKAALLATKQPEPVQVAEPDTIRTEVVKMIEFFAEHDIKKCGEITESTREAAQVQNVDLPKTYNYLKEENGAFNIPGHLTVYNSSGDDVTPEHYNNLQDIEAAAEGGKVISLCNLYELVNHK